MSKSVTLHIINYAGQPLENFEQMWSKSILASDANMFSFCIFSCSTS